MLLLDYGISLVVDIEVTLWSTLAKNMYHMFCKTVSTSSGPVARIHVSVIDIILCL